METQTMVTEGDQLNEASYSEKWGMWELPCSLKCWKTTCHSYKKKKYSKGISIIYNYVRVKAALYSRLKRKPPYKTKKARVIRDNEM